MVVVAKGIKGIRVAMVTRRRRMRLDGYLSYLTCIVLGMRLGMMRLGMMRFVGVGITLMSRVP